MRVQVSGFSGGRGVGSRVLSPNVTTQETNFRYYNGQTNQRPSAAVCDPDKYPDKINVPLRYQFSRVARPLHGRVPQAQVEDAPWREARAFRVP